MHAFLIERGIVYEFNWFWWKHVTYKCVYLINYVCASQTVLRMTWMNAWMWKRLYAFFSLVSFHSVLCSIDHLFSCTTSILSHSKYNLVIKYARNSRVGIAISHWFIHAHTHTHKSNVNGLFYRFILLTHLTYFFRWNSTKIARFKSCDQFIEHK